MNKVKIILFYFCMQLLLQSCSSDNFWSSLFNPYWLHKSFKINEVINNLEFNKIDSIGIRMTYLNNQNKIKDYIKGKYNYKNDSIYFTNLNFIYNSNDILNNQVVFDLLINKIKILVNDSSNYKFKDTNHIPYNSSSPLRYPIYSTLNIQNSKYYSNNVFYYNTIHFWISYHDENYKYTLIVLIKDKYINLLTIVNTHNTSIGEVYFYRDLFELEIYEFIYDFLNSKMQSQELFDFEKKQQLDSLNFENYIPPEYLEKFKKEK